jgi:hypothetical protein
MSSRYGAAKRSTRAQLRHQPARKYEEAMVNRLNLAPKASVIKIVSSAAKLVTGNLPVESTNS